MKQKLLPFAKVVLRALAQLTVAKYKPRIIGVTGSVGKTSTKNAIYTVLSRATDRRVRVAGGNLNNEIGLPLAVLGDYERSGGVMFGVGVVLRALYQLAFYNKDYPELLILEYGIDRPGDMDILLGIARPDIAVVTAVDAVPVHVEFYRGPDEVAYEKGKLVEAVRYGGAAVLNADDEDVRRMRDRTKRKVITFGFGEDAAVRITAFKNKVEDAEPVGIEFKLGAGGELTPVEIRGVFGEAQAYAAAAAAAVGIVEGIGLQAIAASLAFYQGERGRMRLLAGVKNTRVLDDTYNASPASMRVALELLGELPAKRKVAVLGDMMELGEFMETAHRRVGKQVREVADILITVGLRAKFIAEEAMQSGMKKEMVHLFDTSEAAKREVQHLIEEGDLVLVKGSQAMRMEKIVEEIMAEPERKGELLVRQYGKWLKE